MEDFAINPFDAIVITILVLSGIISLTRGFTTEALSLASWAGAAIITLQAHPLIAPVAYTYISPKFMADIVIYSLLGMVSFMILRFLAGKIGDSIKQSHIGALDRALGILFGLVRGMLLISIAYLFVTLFVSGRHLPDWFTKAKSRPLVEYGASMVNALNPYKDKMDFDETRKDIEALQRLKKMTPSFPTRQKKEEEYEEDSQKKMDELFEEVSKE